MTGNNPVKVLLGEVAANITSARELHEDAMDHAALPGSTVYVLHDGRKGWMHGERGTVESLDDQWAAVHFKGRGTLRFKLERLSRQPDGKTCWDGRVESLWYAAGTRTDR